VWTASSRRSQAGQAGVVRLHGGGAVRRVAGAAAPGGELRGEEQWRHDRQRRALERPPRHARARRARSHRVPHRRAIHQRVNNVYAC
jgi:hypothetical protein